MSRKPKPAWCEDMTGGAFATQPPVLTMKLESSTSPKAIYEAMEKVLAERPDSWLWRMSDEIVVRFYDPMIPGRLVSYLADGLTYIEATMVARPKPEIQELVDNPLERRLPRIVDLCE